MGKVSMHIGKVWSRRHNTRDFDKSEWNKDEHINYERSEKNITLADKNLKDVFEYEFKNAIKEFNEKNKLKHPERLTSVNKYYNDKKKEAREIIFQMSDHDGYVDMCNQIGHEQADKIHAEYLKGVYQQFINDNPNFKVFGAYIHFDEIKDGTPHLHLDFLPVAESNRGLSRCVSFDGALKGCQLADGNFTRQGKKYAERPDIKWLRHQRLSVEEQAKEYINVIPSEKATEKHKSTAQYRDEQAKKERVNEVVDNFKGVFKATKAENVLDYADTIVYQAQNQRAKIMNEARAGVRIAEKEREEAKREAQKLKDESKEIFENAVKEQVSAEQDRIELLYEKEKFECEKKALSQEKETFQRNKNKFDELINHKVALRSGIKQAQEHIQTVPAVWELQLREQCLTEFNRGEDSRGNRYNR